jgi:Right handed beta helix region
VKALLTSVLGLLVFAVADAADYYVSVSGADANPGTEILPWRTIQKAADTLSPGDTAWVRGGTYRERVTMNVSGNSEDAFVSFRAYPGEKPIVDGARFIPRKDDTALFLIKDREYVLVQGFEIRRYKATRGNRTPCGILVIGECSNIEIRDNNIHHIAYNSRRGNAFGIAVYGTSATKPITGLVIDGNEVHHCKLGNSESLTVNGNVTGFEVTNNRVHDNNNIGIVFIGFEETCPDPGQDQARDGVCRGNAVWNITSRGNPAYGRAFSAGGIYVDGGTRILIEKNVAHHCDIGVELASEHKDRATSHITLRENFIYRNRIGGLFMGGYDAERGSAENCFVHHNTFFENDTKRDGNGELSFSQYVRNNTITHNMFVAGRQSLLIGNPSTNLSANVLDYNLYFAPAGAGGSAWQWQKVETIGFTSYQQATGQDSHSLFADPLFVDLLTLDFHLTDNSPAVNAGDAAFQAETGETDFDGEIRINGARVDIGADEH